MLSGPSDHRTDISGPEITPGSFTVTGALASGTNFEKREKSRNLFDNNLLEHPFYGYGCWFTCVNGMILLIIPNYHSRGDL